MTIFNASDYGILIGKEIGRQLDELLIVLAGVNGEKILNFDNGEYYIDSDNCHKRLLYITNTIGDGEWKNGETPHLNSVAINLENISDLTFNGNGCVFNMRGQMTNIAMSNCKNINLQDFSIKVENPDLHELEVIRKGIFSIDFKLDDESQYVLQSGAYYFKGKDYKVKVFDNCVTAHWIGKINKSNPERLQRVGHPLFAAYKFVELKPHVFRAYYALPHRYKLGDCFYLFDVRRKFVGIFAERCENLKINKISQHFNYSLAVVCQDCNNVDIANCIFAPPKHSAKRMASVADFIQVCMCRGDINITNNYFVGAGDDCLNTHGVHYKIIDVSKGEITVRYSHAQTHGFNPLAVGDTIRFINPDTLLGDNVATITGSVMASEYDIKLKITDTKNVSCGMVIEDISACPNLNFSNNTMSRIITRGILVTTSGKVVIENNCFVDTYMNSILISDDAKSWYESGNVTDVTIIGNTFMECNGYNVCVKPENGSNKTRVHRNIVIKNNIMSIKRGGVMIKCASGVLLNNNRNLSRKKIINSDIANNKE